MTAERLAIAQVTPFAWEVTNEVNEYVGRVATELARRGHRVVVIAPSNSSALVRESRRAIRAAREEPEKLLERADGEPLVLGVGEVLPFAAARRRASSLPMDVARTIDDALTALPLDLAHMHEPFAPSAASVALRHSRALNVGSFHAPTERILSTQLARPLVELLFSRLDARTASFAATRDLVQRYFPGDYRVIMPGADPARRREAAVPLEIVMVAEEERAAMRLFLRALRALADLPGWRATVWSSRTLAAPATLRRDLAERVRFVGPERSETDVLAAADIAVLASEGVRPTPGTLVRALAAGAVPVTSRLTPYDELLSEGEYGLEFEPGDAETLSAHLMSLIADPELLKQHQAAADPLRARLSWSRVTDELEDIYTTLAARRHVAGGNGAVRKRIVSRPYIDVDLHMHTDHSYDCATPVEVLLAHARARGLGAIAITDHNEVSGAHEARAKASGVKVIVAEEVKTADQGEVIGLFIEEQIPRGLTLAETIAEIKRQGGLVYVPHPFDRMHAVPDYEHLLGIVDD
ncbi:MAG: hypothetical protein QOJ25_2599, partial [Solirubrobacteraceae bacterium]|nr:hypothetical protein [Solirubrobacteraceae bacterium]